MNWIPLHPRNKPFVRSNSTLSWTIAILLSLCPLAPSNPDIPARAKLSGSIRILPIHPLDAQGIVTRISLLEGGQRYQVCERAAPNREWSSVSPDCSPWVGRWVEIELEAATSGPLPHPVALGWAGLRLEVSTGGKPEPTADLIGLAAWGYASMREQGKEETIPAFPAITVLKWERDDLRRKVPILRMDLPRRERPYSLLFRVPVWIPDAVLGSTVRLTPSRSESLLGKKMVKQTSALRWAMAQEEPILHLGREDGNLLVGWGLPGISGFWITLLKEGEIMRVPTTCVGVERTSRGIRATYQCISPVARGLQGVISATSKGKGKGSLILETPSLPNDADLISLDLLGWLYHSKQEEPHVMTSTEGGRIGSPSDSTPWSVLSAGSDLPLLAAFCEKETLIMDWPSNQSLVLGPLGPFHLANAGVRALQDRQMAFRLTCPMGQGKINFSMQDGPADWLSTCKLSREIVQQRWGKRSSKWHRPHVFVSQVEETSTLDSLLDMMRGGQRCPRPVMVPILPEADTLQSYKRKKGWIQADWSGTKGMLWSFKRFLSKQVVGADTPFVRGDKSDIWVGPCWSPSNEGTIPFVDLTASASWTLLSHPGDTWAGVFGPSFSSSLALGRPYTLLSLDQSIEKMTRSFSKAPFLPGVARCGGIPRSSVLTHPTVPGNEGACWTIHLSIPELPCQLKGFTGIADEAGDGDGIFFQISAEGKDFLLRRHQDREWKEFRLDFSAWSGMTVDLQFSVSSGPHGDPAGDWALWGDLSLESQAGEELFDLVSLASQASPCLDSLGGTAASPQQEGSHLLRCQLLAAKMLQWSQKALSGKELIHWIPLEGGGAVAEYEGGIRIFLVGDQAPHLQLGRGALPNGGFYFEGKKGELGLVTEWDGRTYSAATLFWVFSMDRRSLGRSKHVRLVHVTGDPLLRLRSYHTPRSVREGTLMATGEGWYEVHVPEKAEVWLQ